MRSWLNRREIEKVNIRNRLRAGDEYAQDGGNAGLQSLKVRTERLHPGTMISVPGGWYD